MNIRLASATQNKMSDLMTASIDAARAGRGKIDIYSGVQPARADLPAGAQAQLLVSLSFSHPSFAKSSEGIIAANPIDPAKGRMRGRPSWARITDGAGAAVFDCDVGTSDAMIILDTDLITEGSPVTIRSFSIGMPRSAER